MTHSLGTRASPARLAQLNRSPLRSRLILVGLVWLATALPNTWAVAAQGSASVAAQDDLLFTSNRNASVFELWRMSAEGAQPHRVLAEQGEAGEMSWSPDGHQVLYTASRSGGLLNIYVAALGADKGRQLTHDSLPSTQPVWSPDGQTIAFVSMRDGSRRIHLMDADGSRQRRLTAAAQDDEYGPRFSPDGRLLAYVASNLKTRSPRVAMADLRTGQSRIVSAAEDGPLEAAPDWAPDSRQLLFTVVRGQSSHVFAMAADGAGRRQLTAQNQPRNGQPQWSPDGRRILYLSVVDDSGRQGLFLMNTDGSQPVKLHATANDVMDARWASDGQRIFFTEQLPSGGKLFSIDAGGGEVRRLSGNEGFDLNVQVCCGRPASDTRNAVPVAGTVGALH